MSENNKKQKRGGKGKKQQITLVLIFIVGLSIFLYPIVSNAINSRHQTYSVNSYDEEAAKTSQQEKEEMKKEAQVYNESLQEGSVKITDPFYGKHSREAGVSYMDMLNLGETMGHLEIPKINVDLPIYHGTSDAVLQKGVGHIEQSSLPIGGVDTNTVLTGHRGLPTSKLFTDLDKMEVGDLFYIHTLGDTLAYKVNQINVVIPTDIKKLKVEKGKDLVTLVTCTPYMINSHRLLVTGERVSCGASKDTEVDVKSSEPDIESWVSGNLVYAASLIVIIAGLGAILVLRRRKGRLPGGDK